MKMLREYVAWLKSQKYRAFYMKMLVRSTVADDNKSSW